MIRSILLPIAAAALAACGTKTAAPDALGAFERKVPAPLAARSFSTPAVQTATLSNGLEVRVAPNHEVPLWEIRLVLDVGSYADPKGKEGLVDVTFDMANEGAGDWSAEDIARELKRLGGSVGTAAGLTNAVVTAAGPKRNLDDILGIWSQVVTTPTFPDADWALLRDRRLAGLDAEKEDPSAIASKALRKVMYGDSYAGRHDSADSLNAIRRTDMQSTWQSYVGVQNAVLLAGGDITIEELVPRLEKALAGWGKSTLDAPAPQAAPTPIESAKVFFIDKPGAAQSVLRVATTVGDRLDEDHWDLFVGNTAFGGAFTARLNMNLREDKGYTYGARCSLTYRHGPGLWTCGANVNTPVTGPALGEIVKEIDGVLGDAPITDEEIDFFKSFRVNAFFGAYETPASLLGEWQTIWTYDLPTDWLDRYVPGVSDVATAGANTALTKWIDPDKLVWLVVGDGKTIRGDIDAMGLEVVELDREGNPVVTQ